MALVAVNIVFKTGVIVPFCEEIGNVRSAAPIKVRSAKLSTIVCVYVNFSRSFSSIFLILRLQMKFYG